MGTYLNPGSNGFERIVAGEYIDKTMLIEEINKTIGTTASLTCISRPRRFGKSFAAQMLCAYYDCKCDSDPLFKNLKISKSITYKEHINKYNVIYIDVTGFISNLKADGNAIADIASEISSTIRKELVSDIPEIASFEKSSDCMLEYVNRTGKKFVFIIDEWDAPIREAKDDPVTQERYLNLLREWFKNGNFTPKAVAASYMTGILPIKKDGSESAISDFKEFTIINPGKFTAFTGFTQSEVKEICKEHKSDFDNMKEWYDGYDFELSEPIYNPFSVMSAVEMNSFESYWQKTSASENLFTYIDMNFEGLQDDIVRLIAGEQLEVNINGFSNDIKSFNSKDDILTLLIHLGYLAYDRNSKTVKVPNKEVASEFQDLIRNPGKHRLAELIKESDDLLDATYQMDEDYVAKTIDKIRQSSYAPTFYNNEQALRYVIKFAYITCVDRFLRVEELPSGKGVADVVYIPKNRAKDPAIVVELKWDKSGEAAIEQIKQKNYPSIFSGYDGVVLLVGINYDEKNKMHTCKIEKIRI